MNNIVKMLEQNKISCHLIEGGIDNMITVSHNLKEYIISKEDNTYRLLESNLCSNPKRKVRHHEVDKFRGAGEIVEFIVTRKIA